MRTICVGLPYSDDHAFDVELVDNIINEFKKNKAAGFDNLTAELMQFFILLLSQLCVSFSTL